MSLAPGTQTYPLFYAPVAGTGIKVRAIQIGSGTCTVNVTKNASEVGSDLTPGASPTWGSSSTISVSHSAGDVFAVEVKNVSGTISFLVVQYEFTQAT